MGRSRLARDALLRLAMMLTMTSTVGVVACIPTSTEPRTQDLPPPPLAPGIPNRMLVGTGNCPTPTAEDIEAAKNTDEYCVVVRTLDAVVRVRVTGVRAESDLFEWVNWPANVPDRPSSAQCAMRGHAAPAVLLNVDVLDVISANVEVPPALEAVVPAFPRTWECWNPQPDFGPDGALQWTVNPSGDPGGYLAAGLELIMFLYKVSNREQWTMLHHELILIDDEGLTRQERRVVADDWCPSEVDLSFFHVLDAKEFAELAAKIAECANVVDVDLLAKMEHFRSTTRHSIDNETTPSSVNASLCLLSPETWAAETDASSSE